MKKSNKFNLSLNFFPASYLLVILFIFANVATVNSATLNLAKKRSYNLGSGETIVLDLNLYKFRNFSYNSSTKGPFILEKLKGGKIKLTFQSGLLDEKDRIIGKKYSKSFRFTKKNIGQNFFVTFSAIFEPGLSFKNNNKRSTDVEITNINIKDATVVLVSKKSYISRFNVLYNKRLFKIDSIGSGFIINKGENPINIKFITEDNFHEEMTIYGDNGDGRTEKLYVRLKRNVKKSKLSVAKALKMGNPEDNTKAVDTMLDKKKSISPKETKMELNRPSISKPRKADGSIPQEFEKSNLIELISLVLNGFFLIIIIILVIKNVAPKNSLDTDQHFMFYTNAATLLDVNLKGRSFEHTMDEMVIKLIELTDGGQIADKFEGNDYSKVDIDLQKKINDRKELNKLSRSGGVKSPKKHTNVIQKNDDSFLIENDKEKPKDKKNDNDNDREIMNSFSEDKVIAKEKNKSKFESTIDFLSEDDGFNKDNSDSSREELNSSSAKTIEDRRKNLLKFMKKD